MNVALRVRDYMSTDVIVVSPKTDILSAVHLFVERDISGAPVVDAAGGLVGILTERDCITVALHAGYFAELGGQVQEYMSDPVETVAPDENLMDVAERLCHSRFRRYPVVEGGKLVGLISRRDVLRALEGTA
jgi:CBS domain-containing protein